MISPHRNWLNDRDRAGGRRVCMKEEREIIRKDIEGMGGYGRVWKGMGGYGRVWKGMGG